MMRTLMVFLFAIALTCVFGCEPEPGGGAAASAAPAASPPGGPHWQALLSLENPPNAFTVSADVKASYRIGEELRFEIRSSEGGELHVLQVDRSDAVVTLLPNPAMPANRIEADKPFVFPPGQSGVRILAEGPEGESLLAFIVAREDTDARSILPALFPAATPTRGLALLDGPSPPATGSSPWSFARYTIRVEGVQP